MELGDDPVRLDPRRVKTEGGQRCADEKAYA
jgi:hypothetical protein